MTENSEPSVSAAPPSASLPRPENAPILPINDDSSPIRRGNRYQDSTVENTHNATMGNRHTGEEYNVSGPKIEVFYNFTGNGEQDLEHVPEHGHRCTRSLRKSSLPVYLPGPSSSHEGVRSRMTEASIVSGVGSTTSEEDRSRIAYVEEIEDKTACHSAGSDSGQSRRRGQLIEMPAENPPKPRLLARLRNHLSCFGKKTKRGGRKSKEWVRKRNFRFVDITFWGKPFMKVSWGRHNSRSPASSNDAERGDTSGASRNIESDQEDLVSGSEVVEEGVEHVEEEGAGGETQSVAFTGIGMWAEGAAHLRPTVTPKGLQQVVAPMT